MQSSYFPNLKYILIILGLSIALLIGLSGMFFHSSYSALYIGVILCFIAIMFFWIKRPVIALYVFVLVSLLPYGIIPPTINNYLNRVFPVVVLVVWLFGVISHRERIVCNLTTVLMACFLLWSVLTLFWTTNLSIGISFLKIYLVRFVIFLLLIPSLIRTQKNFDGLMNTLAISAWVLVIVSVITVLMTGYLPGTRLKVFGENENAFGLVALVTMIGVSWKALQPLKPNIFFWKLIAMSGSRGSIISLLVTFLAFLLWKTTRSLGKVSFLFLITIGMIAPILFQSTIERFLLIDQTTTIFGGREVLWSAAWVAIKNNPWIGVGIGNSNYVMLSYLQFFRSTLGLEYASVHNPVLTIWLDTGIPGILLYLSSMLSAILLFVQQYFKNKQFIRDHLQPYFGIVASVFIGYMLSWIKGGGIESDTTYFLMLALLLIPSSLVQIKYTINTRMIE
jgi:putative inorganic carbon (HCO3(-)) transporter